MNREQERDAFEQWFALNFGQGKRPSRSDRHDGYWYESTDRAWVAWQYRASLDRHTADQLQAYGDARARQAMEEAAKHLEHMASLISGPHESDGHYALLNGCASAIRGLATEAKEANETPRRALEEQAALFAELFDLAEREGAFCGSTSEFKAECAAAIRSLKENPAEAGKLQQGGQG